MKATRNLFITFALLMCAGGMFLSINDPQSETKTRRESISIIDRIVSATKSALIQTKMPLTIARVGGAPNYYNNENTCSSYGEYSCTWGGGEETKEECTFGVREYDRYGNYKEVQARKGVDTPTEGTYKTGYERNKDKTRKDYQDANKRDQDRKVQNRKQNDRDSNGSSWKNDDRKGSRSSWNGPDSNEQNQKWPSWRNQDWNKKDSKQTDQKKNDQKQNDRSQNDQGLKTRSCNDQCGNDRGWNDRERKDGNWMDREWKDWERKNGSWLDQTWNQQREMD